MPSIARKSEPSVTAVPAAWMRVEQMLRAVLSGVGGAGVGIAFLGSLFFAGALLRLITKLIPITLLHDFKTQELTLFVVCAAVGSIVGIAYEFYRSFLKK